jgi:hypothetical protein
MSKSLQRKRCERDLDEARQQSGSYGLAASSNIPLFITHDTFKELGRIANATRVADLEERKRINAKTRINIR